VETVKHCDACDRPIVGTLAGRGLALPDGRMICGICRPSIVMSESEAATLMIEVARHLERWGIKVDCEDVTILLVGRDKMKLLQDDPDHWMTGFADYNSFADENGRIKCESVNVCLLSGMPELQVKATLAHELMHVWQARHGLFGIDPAVREGSCNYASYLLLEDIGTPMCQYLIRCMMEDLHPDYGIGFREVMRFAEENGVEAWLQKLESTPGRILSATATTG